MRRSKGKNIRGQIQKLGEELNLWELNRLAGFATYNSLILTVRHPGTVPFECLIFPSTRSPPGLSQFKWRMNQLPQAVVQRYHYESVGDTNFRAWRHMGNTNFTRFHQFATNFRIPKYEYKYDRLARGLVYDDYIAAQQRTRPDAHPTQYRKQGRKPAISGKRRSEHSRVGEKDRADGRAGYGSGESRPRRKERGQESRRAMGDKEEGGASLFPHQIVDFSPAPASTPAQPVLSRLAPIMARR